MESAVANDAELVAETGLSGGLLALAAYRGELRRGFARVFCPTLDWTAEKWMRVGAAIDVCGLVVHSATDFNLHSRRRGVVWADYWTGI